MSFVEILSGIRLNLASFEQFVSIACSLADDNPAIKRGIYEATKEIRSSAQLIDHLRSLFNHQQATELERRQHQLFAQSNSSAAAAAVNYKLAIGYHYDRNQQQWPPSSYNYNRQPQQQHNFGAQVEDNNLQYFTYTNQLALIRASKCLVANVAKILYLTDEIVLKGSAQQTESQQQQQQQQQQQRSSTSPTSSQHHRIQEPVASDLNQRANLSDRLDNVANYSQLLRSFSELSCDLVDLGYRIMAARKSRQLAAAAAASKRDLSNNCRSKQPMPTPSPWPSATAAATTTTHYDPMYDPMTGRRATSERQTERTSDCYPSSTSYRNADANFANNSSVNIDTAHEQQQHRQMAPPPAPTMRQQTMAIRPSSSMLFASALPGGGGGGLTSVAVGLGSDSFGLTQDTHRGSLGGGGPMRPPLVAGGQQLLDSATFDASAHTVLQAEQSQRQQALAGGSFAHQDLDQSQLAAQIQDMQVLFQVNRLIIDRSILLLLSASKCCLGQSSERHYGLEARYSIGVQIRVSISIIMALVKCSVFGLYAPSPREPSSPSTTPVPPSPITLPTGANCQQQQSTTTTFDGAQFVSGGGGGSKQQQQQQPPLASGGSSSIQAAAAAQLPLGAINDNNIGRNELQPFGQQQQRQHSSVASKRLLDGGELGGVQFTENSNNRQQAHRYDRPQANYLGAKFNRDDHQQRSLWLNLDNSSYWADAATSTTGGSAWLNYANNQFVAPTSAPGLANIASQQPTVPAATIVPTEPASFCNYLAPDEETNMSKADQQKQQQQQYYNSMAQYYNGQAVLYDELISQHLAEEDAQLFSVGPGRVLSQQRNARRGPLAVATDQQLHQQQQQHPFRVSTLETGHLGGGRGGHETGLGTATEAKLAIRSNTTAAATTTTTTTTTTKQFDIVNYFLLTTSGTPSAHDALHGLQLLVEPFERVSNQDELAGELDEALVFVASGHFYRLAKQRQLILRQPASLSSPKNAATATVTGSSKTNYIQSPRDVHYLANQDGPPELGLGEPKQLTGGGGLPSELSEQRRQQAAAAAVVQQFGYANSHQALRHASAMPVAASMSLTGAAVEKENQDPAANSSQQHQLRATRMAATNWHATANQQVMELLEQMDLARPVALMNKRQLVKALNLTFLGEVKSNLVKGVHEFTDCAYTKHESRETILSLLAYVKFQLNKFVRLIYRLRRRSGSLNEPNQLALLRQIACQLVDACAELDYEVSVHLVEQQKKSSQFTFRLKTVAVEQSDELDRCSTNLNLIKKLKHHCLVGDVAKERAVSSQFGELADQLIETCKMLNQIAPTNKIKITTKVLATWFQLNLRQLLNSAHCLSESPRSREAKDCTWAYIQVWSSFYDDFCQLARQVAYLVHSAQDLGRSARGAHIREQISLSKMSSTGGGEETDLFMDSLLMAAPFESFGATSGPGTRRRGVTSSLRSLDSVGNSAQSSQQSLNNNNTTTGMSDNYQQQIASRGRQYPFSGQQPAVLPPNDSPRSLDHYHGFGPNYRRSHDQARHQQHQFQQLHHYQYSGSDSGTPIGHAHHSMATATSITMSPERMFGTQSGGDDELSEQPLAMAPIGSAEQLGAHSRSAFTRLAGNEMHQANYTRSPYNEDHRGEPAAAAYDSCSDCLQSSQAAGSILPQSMVPSLDERTSGLDLGRREDSQQLQWKQQQQQHQYQPQGLSQSYPRHRHQHHHHHQRHHRLPHRPPAASKLMTMVSVDPGAASIEPPGVQARHPAPLGALDHNQTQQLASVYDGGAQPMPRRPPPPPPPQPFMNSYNIGGLHESGIHHRRTAGGAPKSGQRRHMTQEGEVENREVVVVEEVASAEEEAGQSEQDDELAHLSASSAGGGSVKAQVGLGRHQQPPTLHASAVVAPTSAPPAADQQSIISSTIEPDKWSDSEADAIVRGARETAQMALSMYQFTRGEGDLNTTQDLFTQAELFAEEANELYKEVRCFSYKVPAGDLKKELLFQLSTIPAFVQQLQFTVKNPTVGKAATFTKVDCVIRETKSLMEAVNRVVEATLSCRQHYNMATASLRKRTRTLSPSYRGDKGGFEFDSMSSSGGRQQGGGAFGGFGGRHTSGASGSMGSEPDI